MPRSRADRSAFLPRQPESGGHHAPNFLNNTKMIYYKWIGKIFILPPPVVVPVSLPVGPAVALCPEAYSPLGLSKVVPRRGPFTSRFVSSRPLRSSVYRILSLSQGNTEEPFSQKVTKITKRYHHLPSQSNLHQIRNGQWHVAKLPPTWQESNVKALSSLTKLCQSFAKE
jgi:hypothetical protein